MNILIYRTGRLGDFLVAVPAIGLIRRAFPQAHLTLVTCISSRKAVADTSSAYLPPSSGLPWLNFIYPSLVDEILYFTSLRDWNGLVELHRSISSRHFDRAFFLPFALEPFWTRLKKWVFLRALGVHSRIYGLRAPNGLFATIGIVHQVQVARDVVAQCPEVSAFPASEDAGRKVARGILQISESDVEWAGKEWSEQGWTDKQVIAVFTGGTHAHKRWAPENFAEICRRLGEISAVAFVFIGSANEMSDTEPAMRASTGRYRNFCGETTLGQLAALLQKCALFLGNDSGPGHLAASLGIPCVTIMSEVHAPGIWEPWGESNLALRFTVPCRGCGCETHCPAGTQNCIKGIAVDVVLAACTRRLKQTRMDATTDTQ